MQAYPRIALTVFAFTLYAGGAFGESTEVMLSACRPIAKAEIFEDKVTIPQDFPAGTCWGAFAVLQEIIRHTDRGRRVYSICAPANSTRSQLIAVFVDYTGKNPQRLHEDFFNVAVDSLRVSFPCETGR